MILKQKEEQLSMQKVVEISTQCYVNWPYQHSVESVQLRSYFWSVFSCIRRNTEIYSVNLRIQSEYRKIRTRENPAFGHFSLSTNKSSLAVNCQYMLFIVYCCSEPLIIFCCCCFYQVLQQIINNDIIFNMADTKIKWNRPIPFSIVLVPNYCKWLTCLEPVLCSVWNIFCLLACLLLLPLMETEHLAVCLQTCHVLWTVWLHSQ